MDLCSGEKKQFWQDAFPAQPPFGTGPDTLWIGYMSSAEWGCFLSLGWQLPEHILDPYVEFKNCTNVSGVTAKVATLLRKLKVKGPSLRPHGAGLLGAAITYGTSNGEITRQKKSENYVFSASALGYVTMVFGWRAWVSPHFNERSIQNFPCQANAAEMLRLACCLGGERGVDIAAPVHDATLVVAPLDCLDADIEKMRQAMTEASMAVLGGFAVDVEVDKVVKYPHRYVDKRGAEMWARLEAALERAEDERI